MSECIWARSKTFLGYKSLILTYLNDDPEPVHARLDELALPVSVVLAPILHDQHAAEGQGRDGHHEGSHGSIASKKKYIFTLGQVVCDL